MASKPRKKTQKFVSVAETLGAEFMDYLEIEGMGFDRIAAKMNAEGIETRTRGRWHGIMVNRILGKDGANGR